MFVFQERMIVNTSTKTMMTTLRNLSQLLKTFANSNEKHCPLTVLCQLFKTYFLILQPGIRPFTNLNLLNTKKLENTVA